MKNFINYYYGIEINNIIKDSGKIFFEYNGENYALKKINNFHISENYGELIEKISKYTPFSKIIRNKFGKIITTIQDNNYILFKIFVNANDLINIYNIENNSFIDNEFSKCVKYIPWINLWEQKIDYFENYFNSKKNQLFKAYWECQYVIGIAEMALLYLKVTEQSIKTKKCDNLAIQHRRINKSTSMLEYYDPTNIIIDHSSRDIGEYIKNLNIEEIDLEKMDKYFKKRNLSTYWIQKFYSRILFPSFIFDKFEEIINNQDLDMHKFLEEKINNHIKIINKIGKYLNKEYDIPIINFKIK